MELPIELFCEGSRTIRERCSLMNTQRNKTWLERGRIECQRYQSKVTSPKFKKLTIQPGPSNAGYADFLQWDVVIACDLLNSTFFGVRSGLSVINPECANVVTFSKVIGEPDGT